MDRAHYDNLTADALAGAVPDAAAMASLLTDPDIDLMPLLHAAYAVRRHHFGHTVQVHILNNAQNGRCPEDCSYCTQAKTSEAGIEPYAMKSPDEVLAEAERAYRAGAMRYCMVFSGRGPSAKRTAQLADLVRTIKGRFPSLQVCVSAGLLDEDKAHTLAGAGLDRLNHNLNTSRETYADICTTHTYDDRLNTLRAAKGAGLQTCSGVIAGMGETAEELVEVALTLREINSESIPVNFLLPFEGNVLDTPAGLTPAYCLRVLCMFRFTNPRADVRCAAGREYHLRSLEPLCLYPANSLFLDGYLNGRGAQRQRTYRMIRDLGFTIVSDHDLDDLLEDPDAAPPTHPDTAPPQRATITVDGGRPTLKTIDELRPARAADTTPCGSPQPRA